MNGASFDRTETKHSRWRDLPEQLDALWGACMQEQRGSDVARALTANFVGVARAEHAERLLAVTEQLQHRSPCRAFLLLLDDSQPHTMAALTATTRRHGPLRDIVLEQIVLRLRTDDLARMPGLLRPLTLDDLPSHLLWALPWPEDEARFDTLAGLAEHAIVDSQLFEEPSRELQIVKDRRDRGEQLSDLSWLRARPWRRALAEAFERFEWRPNVAVRCTIEHGRRADAMARLLGDWLHERLAAVTALEHGGDDELSGPARVRLQVGDIEVVVEHADDALITHVTTPSRCFLPFTHRALRGSDAELLVLAMDKH